jgi:hypothetical protein
MACCWLHFCICIHVNVWIYLFSSPTPDRGKCAHLVEMKLQKQTPHSLAPFRSAKVLVHFHQQSLEWIVRGQSAPLASSASHACIAISRRKFASANRCSKNDSAAAAAAGPPSIIYPLPWHNTEWIAAGPQHTHSLTTIRESVYVRSTSPPYAQWNCNCARAHYFFINARACTASVFIFRAVYLWRRCNNSEMRPESYCTLATGIKPPRANFHSLSRRFFMDSLGWSETQKCMYVCRVLTTKSNNQVEMGFRRNYG